MDDVILTQEGYDEIVAELTDFKNNKLQVAIDRVATARSFGDLSENSEYHAAREDLAFMEGRIAELEQLLSKAKVIKAKKGRSSVGVGSTVTVHIGKIKHTYQIVGEWEANPAEKKISESSPLGKALLGKKEGEELEVDAPAGKIKYKVASIQ
ncbi:transcription elongation factor GreA [Candidatus Woesebacteria bacterium]|nr:transcription elongation factor GreA [Candidatus Woesebacteria bacterium]